MTDNHAVPAFGNHMFVNCAGVDGEINKVSWSPSSDWPFDAEYFSCHDFGVDLFILEHRNRISLKLLILRFAIFVLSVEI